MVEYITVIFLAILTLPRAKFSLNKSNSLTLQNSTYLRGFLCVLIFLNHFAGWFENQGIIFYFFSHIGSFVVGVFFFLSGFGLMKAYPGDVNFSFLIKRFVKTMIPYWICELVYSLISVFFDIPIKVEVNIKNIALSTLQMSEIVENSWYVGATLVLYIAFFICKKILPRLDMTVKLVAVLVIFSLLCRSVSYWTTFFAFPLGTLACEYENEIAGIKKGKRFALIFVLVIFCLSAIALKYYGYNIDNSAYMNISDMLTSILFAAIVYFIFTFLHIGNSALGFLGKISYEFYLMHGLGIRLAYKIFGLQYDIMFAASAIFITLIMSLVIYLISSFVLNPIIKKLNNSEYLKGK